jgi:hypothetical protein
MGGDGIAAFWSWWPAARGQIEAAIGGGGFPKTLVSEIAQRVAAIDKDLDWELSPGGVAQHALCLSAKGDPVLRRTTERWLAAAPAADATWEFHAARIGRPGSTNLTLEGHQLDFAELQFAFEVDPGREVVNVTCFHPAFAKMTEQLRGTATFLLLDGAFGEDAVERWFGGIEVSATPPDGARPAAELTAAVAELERTATRDRFAILQGKDGEGRPIVVTLNTALKRIDNLTCDHHVAVTLMLLDPRPDGLTTAEEADHLNAIEDQLGGLVAGRAVYLGRETRRGQRVMHYFAADDAALKQKLAAWADGQRARGARVEWRADPTWEARARFL